MNYTEQNAKEELESRAMARSFIPKVAFGCLGLIAFVVIGFMALLVVVNT